MQSGRCARPQGVLYEGSLIIGGGGKCSTPCFNRVDLRCQRPSRLLNISLYLSVHAIWRLMRSDLLSVVLSSAPDIKMATLSAHRSARLLIIIDAQQATDVSTVYSDDNVATVTQGHTVRLRCFEMRNSFRGVGSLSLKRGNVHLLPRCLML